MGLKILVFEKLKWVLVRKIIGLEIIGRIKTSLWNIAINRFSKIFNNEDSELRFYLFIKFLSYGIIYTN